MLSETKNVRKSSLKGSEWIKIFSDGNEHETSSRLLLEKKSNRRESESIIRHKFVLFFICQYVEKSGIKKVKMKCFTRRHGIKNNTNYSSFYNGNNFLVRVIKEKLYDENIIF